MTLKVKASTGVFEAVGGDGGSIAVEPYVRPADWLALPSVVAGNNKLVGLFAVHDTSSNYVALSASVSGGYAVDWGDGSAVQNVASGVTAYHNFVFSALSSGTLTSRGYRQAVITITPQAANNFTVINLALKHNAASSPSGLLSSAMSTGWLDIKMAGSAVSTLTVAVVGQPAHRMLEQFEYVGTNVVTDWFRKFVGCGVLQSIPQLWTASGNNFSNMFETCRSLQTIPLLNTALGTNFTSMFSTCTKLREIPLLNTALGTNFVGMFASCTSLQEIPLLNTSSGLDFSTMFSGCVSLRTIPLLNTSSGTNFTSMFASCGQLLTITLLNTSSGTNFTSMFAGCGSLVTIPLLNTSAGLTFSAMFNACGSLAEIPLLNTSAGVTFTNMFTNCAALVTIPLLNTSAGVTFTTMFGGCTALVTIPLLDTSAGVTFTSMFTACSTLQTVPSFDTSKGINFTNMFAGCDSLKSAPLSGTAWDITYIGQLGGPELNAVYTNLATITNMLSSQAASAEVSSSVVDWSTGAVNNNGGVARSSLPLTPPAYVSGAGPNGFLVTSLAAGVVSNGILTRLAVTAGNTYTFLAKAFPNASPNKVCGVSIAWYDAGAALLSTDAGSTATCTWDTWTQVAVTAVAPVGAVTASVRLIWTATATNQGVLWDAIGLFPGTISTWSPGKATITVTGLIGVGSDTPSIATNKGWTVVGS